MSEDLTQNLPPRPFEERVLAELASMRSEFRSELAAIRGDIGRLNTRLTSLESKVDRLDEKVDRLDEKVDRLDARVERLEAKVDRLETRADALEDKVDRRMQETRPIWEDVQVRLQKLATKFDLVIQDLFEVRQDQAILLRRVDQLEGQRAE